jgi:hypothetical protein
MTILKIIGLGVLSWLAVVGIWCVSAWLHHRDTRPRERERADDP